MPKGVARNAATPSTPTIDPTLMFPARTWWALSAVATSSTAEEMMTWAASIRPEAEAESMAAWVALRLRAVYQPVAVACPPMPRSTSTPDMMSAAAAPEAAISACIWWVVRDRRGVSQRRVNMASGAMTSTATPTSQLAQSR